MKLKFRDVPCVTCPYRCDAPPGLWHPEEHEKLLKYDLDTIYQPQVLFSCHNEDRTSVLCRGWFETHGTDLLAVRLASMTGRLDLSVMETCSVKCFSSGRDAAEHGMSQIEKPPEATVRMAEKLVDRHQELLE